MQVLTTKINPMIGSMGPHHPLMHDVLWIGYASKMDGQATIPVTIKTKIDQITHSFNQWLALMPSDVWVGQIQP
jgi:hypothetical protein